MSTLSNARRYRTAAEHYARGRLSYPAALIREVAAATRLEPRHRVLDLGCGPGFLAVAFRPLAAEVIGIDPEPEMLRQAEAHARRSRVEISFREGSSATLDQTLGVFQLVTMGRSFHWMDRVETLKTLDGLVSPEGALALFSDRHPDVPENAWKKRYEAVLAGFGGDDEVYRSRHRNPAWIPNDALLRQSRFNRLRTLTVTRRLSTPVESILDRALSMSFTTPERLQERLDDFLAQVREVLEAAADANGAITEVVESVALVASRGPAEGAAP